MAGILSVVGTPIGNLEDASPRVRRTLGEANVILCEDTRVTARLLSAFDLHVPLVRCDENVMRRVWLLLWSAWRRGSAWHLSPMRACRA